MCTSMWACVCGLCVHVYVCMYVRGHVCVHCVGMCVCGVWACVCGQVCVYMWVGVVCLCMCMYVCGHVCALCVCVCVCVCVAYIH